MPVLVASGRKAAAVDIVMRRAPAWCVRGEVRDGNGSLLKDVAIGLAQESWSAGIINEGGRFLLTRLPAGSYTLVVSDVPELGRVLARRVIRVSAGNRAAVVIVVK